MSLEVEAMDKRQEGNRSAASPDLAQNMGTHETLLHTGRSAAVACLHCLNIYIFSFRMQNKPFSLSSLLYFSYSNAIGS